MKHAIPYLIFLFIFLQSSCKEDNTSSIEEIYVVFTTDYYSIFYR